MGRITFTAEQAADIIRRKMEGQTNRDIGEAYNRSTTWVSDILHSNGWVYNKGDMKYEKKQDGADMNGTSAKMDSDTWTEGGWSMSNDEYEKLLESDRPARIQVGDIAVNEPQAPDETKDSERDADLEEARALLARATQMRRDDKAKINTLSAQLESALQRIDYLESEEKRLHKENKRIQSEISRRLLRQDMDDLRTELDN